MPKSMEEIIIEMRGVLVPKGTEPVVRLFMNSSYYDQSFISKCIRDVTRLSIREGLGDEINSLEKLGLHVLLASSYIELSRD